VYITPLGKSHHCGSVTPPRKTQTTAHAATLPQTTPHFVLRITPQLSIPEICRSRLSPQSTIFKARTQQRKLTKLQHQKAALCLSPV
jgi:hypothetical protein